MFSGARSSNRAVLFFVGIFSPSFLGTRLETIIMKVMAAQEAY